MPYTACPKCGLRVYTAAVYSTADSCARCGTNLPRKSSADRNGRHLRYAAEALEQLMGSAARFSRDGPSPRSGYVSRGRL